MSNPKQNTFMRCAFYGRYSTNMQRPASIDDQKRVCSEFAAQQEWEILDEHLYVDEARSGTRKLGRKGLEALEAAAEQRPLPFDYILFDDTSRLGRDQADVLQTYKLMKHHGIRMFFVSQRLDSADPNFPMLLNFYSMMDAQQITRIKHKVFEAQKGRVLAGYIAGSWPYGYRAIVEENVSLPRAIGRAATTGTRLEAVEGQAEIVRRIFQLYADGYSLWGIAVRLNQEGVPRDSQFRSRGKGNGWPVAAIKKILHNEKYKGVFVWNRSTQLVHPVTGKINREVKPAHDHITIEMPHLRIVSDDLWNRAADRLKQLNDKQEARKAGGYNRAKDKPYLYSGLLFCGVCGSLLRCDGPVRYASYMCPNYRLRRGCNNSYRIRQDRAAAQITEQLSSQLMDLPFFNSLVGNVYGEVKDEWARQKTQAESDDLPQLENARRECQRRIDGLLDGIENAPSGGPASQTLSARLSQRHSELERLESKIRLIKGSKRFSMSEQDLRELVRTNINNLLGALQSDIPFARKLLQQSLKRIVLFPGVDENGHRYFEVVGEMDPFHDPDDQNSCVLLGSLGTQTSQQHTFNSSYGFLFRLYQDADPCQLLEYFVQLLEIDPSLSSRSLRPTEWSNLLRGVIPEGSRKPTKLGYGVVARCFWFHQDQLSERLIIKKLPNPRDPGHRYQLSLRRSA